MVRALILVLVLALYGPCSKNRPNPQPLPSPAPVIKPTPITPTVTPPAATPYPTPAINPSDYIPTLPLGKTVVVSGENLAVKIQAAQDDAEISTVRIEGGGSITQQVILKKHTVFDSSTYSCDVQGITDYGVFLIADGVLVEGTWRIPQVLIDYFQYGNGHNWQDPHLLKVQALSAEDLAGTGTTILEPTFVNDSTPAIEVFQALGDTTGSHTGSARDIAVIGFHIKGRQKVYDGGVRSTILLGNCHHCTAQNNYLEDTGSIGITAGGSALEKNNFANDVLMWRNVFSGVAAANTATINTENAYVVNNYVRRPGHHDPVFGGGVCGHDHETNSTADHTRNIYVFNNLYDFEGANRDSAGSAICLQDPYVGENRGRVVAANNVIIGGRLDNEHRYLSNGILMVGISDFEIVNNYIYRTAQNAIQAYGISRGLIQDNDFESTGGGSNPTMVLNEARETVLRRNNYRARAGLGISTQPGMVDKCGSGNKYEENRTLGELAQPAFSCP